MNLFDLNLAIMTSVAIFEDDFDLIKIAFESQSFF